VAATRQTAENRDISGLRPWKAGQSGNTGHNKAYAGMLRLARVHSREALMTLVECINDASAPWPARVVAANSILDRAFGKPKETLQFDGADAVTSITLQIVRPGADGEQAPVQSTPPVIIEGNAEPGDAEPVDAEDATHDGAFTIRIAKPAEWD
jgi:hypothetical protein